MIGVEIKSNEPVERALNRFKKKIVRSKILKSFKNRQQYIKPSVVRREALKRSIKEEKRRQRRYKWI